MGTCYQISGMVVMGHMLVLKPGILAAYWGAPRIGVMVDPLFDNRQKSFQHLTKPIFHSLLHTCGVFKHTIAPFFGSFSYLCENHGGEIVKFMFCL
jgi:hypothetical protein